MEPIYLDHPLLKHKISTIREKSLSSGDFRREVEDIAVIEFLEACKDLPTFSKEIETPITKTTQPFIDPKKVVFVPILRAGLGMEGGVLRILPEAKVYHLGMKRDEKTHMASCYYNNLPFFHDETVFLLDPMLATGGSGIDAVKVAKEHGAKKIKFLAIIAAPEGVKAFIEKCPDVELYVGALDERLNENAYIVPGLGDAGDRVFGTEN